MQDEAALQHDLVDLAVRSLVLYSLAEYQAGHADAIHVRADAQSFEVSDNGRGHSIDRTIEGTPYVELIYSHFAFAPRLGLSVPVQLQGIGLSLINCICSELKVTVLQRAATLQLSFAAGQLVKRELLPSAPAGATGNSVSGTISTAISHRVGTPRDLERWLSETAVSNPSLKLFYNGLQLPHKSGAA